MIPGSDAIEYRRLRAPRQHGEVFIDPPLADAPRWLDQNRRRLHDWNDELHGRSARELASDARHALLELARRHTSEYLDANSDTLDRALHEPLDAPLVVTGHQPHLFHPGVWYKNFAADRIARASGAIAINLLVDNDTLRSAALKVPTGAVDAPRVDVVPFDRQGEEMPFEERAITDLGLFESFGGRAVEVLRPLVPRPLLESFWPRAVRAARTQRRVGRSLARARHELEHDWGLRTLEVPLGELCDTVPFRWFASHLLARADAFRSTYNQALAEYRDVHGIRSRSHPVPELAREGAWTEAPFWIWSNVDPQRRRLFVRREGERVELTDRRAWTCWLDLPQEGSAERAVEQLAAETQRGVRLRSRAITTTLFARLLASDLFLHGIGGAKYDQLTDALVRRFFRRSPPTFVTLTLTAQLPIPHPVVTRDDVRMATWRLREFRFHPERYAGESISAEIAALVAEKQRWLDTHPPRGEGRPRHEALQRINASLATLLDDRRQQLADRRHELGFLAARHALLASREYSFCLFPEEALRPLLT